MFSPFHRIAACDRQADGRTNILARHSPRYAYASRVKSDGTTGQTTGQFMPVTTNMQWKIKQHRTWRNSYLHSFQIIIFTSYLVMNTFCIGVKSLRQSVTGSVVVVGGDNLLSCWKPDSKLSPQPQPHWPVTDWGSDVTHTGPKCTFVSS